MKLSLINLLFSDKAPISPKMIRNVGGFISFAQVYRVLNIYIDFRIKILFQVLG